MVYCEVWSRFCRIFARPALIRMTHGADTGARSRPSMASQVRQPGRQDRAAEDSDGSQASNCECMSSESEDEQVAVQDATRVLSIIVECGRFSLHTHELSGITHLSQNQATKLCCQSTAGTAQDIVLAATRAAAALLAARLRRVS